MKKIEKNKDKSKKKKKGILPFGETVDPNAIFMRRHLRIMLGDMGEMFPYRKLASSALFS